MQMILIRTKIHLKNNFAEVFLNFLNLKIEKKENNGRKIKIYRRA